MSFDETYEEQESREKFEFFFGQYSSEIRKRLLSKNVPKPDNLYDILYTKVRQDLLAKNQNTFDVNLDDKARSVRDKMLSNHVENQINLDLAADNYRQKQVSKNNLLQSSVDLNKMSDSVRDNLVSKNTPTEIDLDKRAKETRDKNLSNNTEKEINLDQNANNIRNTLLSNNKTDNNKTIDSIGDSVRGKLLSANDEANINLDRQAEVNRNSALSKNKENDVNLDKQASQYREKQTSANKETNINLDSTAETVRKTLLSNNKESEQSIDKIADTARQKNESANIEGMQSVDNVAKTARPKMLSNNTETPNNIDKIADTTRNIQESNNKESDINLDKTSDKVRSAMLSANKADEINLDEKAGKQRDALLSANKGNDVNLDATAEANRKKLLSNNKESDINIDKSAEITRNNLLSANKGVDINLDKSSEAPRENLLSANKPIAIDLDKDAQAPRSNLLASNVPSNIDLDANAENPRNNLLASNVPNNVNLDDEAEKPRKNLLASNVPVNIDLDKNAEDPRKNLLAHNVPSNIDLDAMAGVPRGSLLATNVPKDISLDADAINPRNHLLNSNVPNNINLDANALIPRNTLLAANTPKSINLEVNALQIRNNLLAANVGTPNTIEDTANIFRHDLLAKNAKSKGLGTNVFLAGTSVFIGVSNLDIISLPIRALMKLRGTIFDANTNIQGKYGLSLSGGVTPLATITNAAQLYNLQKNAFMNVRYLDKTSGYNNLLSNNADGFQQMLSMLGTPSSKRETETNTTPASVIAQNQGAYVGLPTNINGTSPVTRLIKPVDGDLGSATSMMSNTVPTDMIAANFNKNERGVVRIINTIKKDGSIAMAKNYDSQNSTSFIIGTNSDGTNKIAYTRYTIANPYQPSKDAGALELRIKNYAIYNGNKKLVHTMSFPPYVKAFANSDSANWNKVDYLGRPEPIFTYSNSNREGSLSFYILTDYSQEVDIGYDYATQTQKTENFAKHFTDQIDKSEKNSDIEVEIKDKENQVAAYNEMLAETDENDVSGKADINKRISELNQEISNLEAKQKENTSGKGVGAGRDFKEFDKINGNIYKTLINNGAVKDTSGNIDLQTEQTAQRLARMKKDLLFQPGFFSGDKVDFLTRMEFIAKLTRPARSASNRGFSFTFPPVCHIHLGDWFNHDVVINSVSYDYSDAPWTVDGSGGRTQPMWALVSLSFNIVGTYESQPGQDVPLATDIGGFFQKRQKTTGAPAAPSKKKK